MTSRSSRWAACVAWLAWAATAAPAGPAADILAKAGIRRGVACVPRCGDGSLATELAGESELIVLAMDPDAANVAAARRSAQRAGLLGRRLYVQQGSAEAIPFADHYVDLLVLAGVGEANLSSELRAEILRVLSPTRGRAVLADATLNKPAIPGSDWWPAKLHGPNNNPVSRDKAFRFPPILQYRALPLYNASMGAALTVDGIHYEIHDWLFKTPTRANLCGRVTARSVYNGRRLWEGLIPERMMPSTPTLASSSTDLLLASGTRGEVVRMDLKTGETRPPIRLAGDSDRIKWLACTDNVIYALIGTGANLKPSFSFYVGFPDDVKTRKAFLGTRLVAWDLASGKVKWRHEEPTPIDQGNVAVHDGKLTFYALGKRLACLNAADGSLLWENADTDWIGTLESPGKSGNPYVDNASIMIAADGILRLSLAGCKDVYIFQADDGTLLSKVRGPTQKGCVLDGNPYFASRGFDAKTGKELPSRLDSPAGWAWCGLATYSEGTGVLGHSTLGYKSPCATGAWVAGGMLVYSPTVCDCGGVPGTGAFASGGEIARRIAESPAHPLVRGPAFGRAPGGPEAGADDWPSHRGGNRRRGASAVAVGTEARTIAWAALPAVPFEYSTLYNQYVLDPDERPVAPIVVGERVFTAGSDGRVACLSLADGRELWAFQADGPVFSPPAYATGRLFVPSGDGWVYALDTADGTLAWRRRVAPVERRIVVFGQIVSNWPVLSLLVDDGVVFASAGHAVTDGGVTLAMDARTGEIDWSHATRGVIQGSHQAPPIPAQGYGGHMAVVGDRIWGAGHYSAPVVLDRRSGADPLLELKETLGCGNGYVRYKLLYYTLGGQDVVVVDDRAVMVGGNRLFENQQMREGKRQRIGYKVYFTDEKGDWGTDVAPLRAIKLARVTPACDDELVVFAAPPPVVEKRGRMRSARGSNRATVGLNVWTRDRFLAAARAMQAGGILDEKASRRGRMVFKRAYDAETFKDLDHTAAAWRKPELDVNAIALAGDAILVAHAAGDADLFTWNSQTLAQRKALVRYVDWKLTAFARDADRELWSVKLPSEPLYNGIAIAADGTVLVTLRDGSVLACTAGSSGRRTVGS